MTPVHDSVRRRVLAARRARAAALALAGLLSAGGDAAASQLLAPAVGVADGALNGATVATPLTPAAAAFSNPAGLTALEDGAMSLGLGVATGHSGVHATLPPGYDTTSDFVAFAPEAGSVFRAESGLRYGFALYGSLGSQFDSDADPSVGVDHDFYSSQGISNLSVMAARPFGDRFSLGAELTLVYGQVHLRYFQNAPYGFTVRGAGVQAMLGARYRVTDRISVGLGYRTPGMVWGDGDNGGTHQDVGLDLDLPAQVFAGVNADVTDRLFVGLCGRWTDASQFGNSIFHFAGTPQADIPFIRDATDEWRIGGGARYRLTDTLSLSGGLGYADSIVPGSWVSPLLIDSSEWKITVGLSWVVGRWTLDFTFGESPNEGRNVQASEAVVFPGRYEIGGQIYMIGLRTTL